MRRGPIVSPLVAAALFAVAGCTCGEEGRRPDDLSRSELRESVRTFIDRESARGAEGVYFAEAGQSFLTRCDRLKGMEAARRKMRPPEADGGAVARRMDLKSFGAIGDGVADDAPAFQRAFNAMRAAGGAPTALVVPPGTYALRSVRCGAHLLIDGLTNAVVIGHGAEVRFGVFDASGCEIVNCDNVTVRGLAFEWEQTPFFQGRILEVDAERATVVARRMPGTLSPCAGCWTNQTKGVRGAALSGLQYYCASQHDAKTGRIHPEASWNFFLAEAESLGDEVFRIRLDPAKRYDRSVLRVGCDLVIPCRDNRFHAVRQKDSVFCTISECVVRSSRSGAFSSSGRTVVPSFVNCRVEPKAGYALSSNADGCISVPGTVIRNCRFASMGDDGINVRGIGMNVVKFESPRTIVVPWRSELSDGVFLALFDPQRGDYLQGLRIESISRVVHDGRDCARIVADRDVTVSVETKSSAGGRLVTQGVVKPKVAPTQVYAIDALGMGSEVYECEIRGNRGCGIVVQDSFSRVENCTVDGMKSGLRVGALARYREGPAPVCVTVCRNRLLNTVNALSGLVNVMRGGPGDASPMRHVVFEDNIISNVARKAVDLHNFDVGVWRNNFLADATGGVRLLFSNGTVGDCQSPVAKGDFGVDAFGWLEVRAKTPRSCVLRVGEQLNADGSVNVNPPGAIRGCVVTCEVATAWTRVPFRADLQNTQGVNGEARAVALPQDVGVVMPFRHVQKVEGPEDLEMRRVFLHWPMPCKVRCPVDDPKVKEVWDFCQYTIVATSFAGIMVDGDRERIPYEGDIYINMLGQLYGVDGDPELSRRSIRHVLKYPTWPTEWKQHAIMCVWEDWNFTKSTALAAECYDQLKREKLMLDRARPDGLLPSAKSDLVDWPATERDGYDMKTPCNAVVNAFHYRNLREMADLAKALGKSADAQTFGVRAESVLRRFNELFYDSERRLYVDGEGSRHVSLHANVAALDFGLVPKERQSDVVDFIANRGMVCSPYFAQYYLEALCKYGRQDAALRLITAENDRSWKGMIDQGATMTMEAWSQKAKPNQDWNHAWGTAPLNILARFCAKSAILHK